MLVCFVGLFCWFVRSLVRCWFAVVLLLLRLHLLGSDGVAAVAVVAASAAIAVAACLYHSHHCEWWRFLLVL